MTLIELIDYLLHRLPVATAKQRPVLDGRLSAAASTAATAETAATTGQSGDTGRPGRGHEASPIETGFTIAII
ncbi:hypothetical protein [Haladaptatus halobius]|uniref:hypothetical protein n=1 Tax=Haladaptatus halobius TaxID=2884875 RepID=UPI001D0B2E42|nr:hypothetical protein [Haladaptatus halobius]